MKFKRYITALAIPLTFMVSGCDKLKDFDDTNVNPGGVTRPIVGALLTNVEAGLGGFAASTRSGLYSQLFAETQYTEVSLYSTPQLEFSGEYSGSLMDLQDIINANVSNNQTQVARILQQYIFWTITDRWGDVPYSEALKGNPTPKYDTQEEIYKGMIATLENAVKTFDATSPITGDVIYNGNVAAWKKAANSMRLLMALRLSKRYSGANDYAATQFKAALGDAAGIIDENTENMTLRYPGGNFKNPWFNVYNGRRDYGQSKTLTDLMSSLGDQRQTVFGGASDDPTNMQSSSVGMPYGLVRAKAEAFTSANQGWARILRSDFRQENSPQVIIGAADVNLARAEAADYGWTTDNLQTVFQTGVTQSFQQWGLSAPPPNYFTQASVALTAAPGTGANLPKIAVQRYIAAYPNGLQAWSIWRKTGYPALTPAPDATNTSKLIPRRYVYGTQEEATNQAAYQAAVGRLQGGNTQDARVWWDRP